MNGAWRSSLVTNRFEVGLAVNEALRICLTEPFVTAIKAASHRSNDSKHKENRGD